jgi:hypothetical protein
LTKPGQTLIQYESVKAGEHLFRERRSR